jgi:hypothetical protein
MRLALVLAVAVAGCATAGKPPNPDCSNSPAHACQPGDECRTSADGKLHACLPVPPRPEEMSPTARTMLEVGRSLQLGWDLDQVDRAAAPLGPPARTYQRCDAGGCTDVAGEEAASAMVVFWQGADRDNPVLSVELCGGPGGWRAAHVSMSVTSPGGGAWGTFPRLRPVFSERSEDLRRRCVR